MANEFPKINIAFLSYGDYWLGGINYLRNLLAAIRSVPESGITPILFTGARGSDISTNFPQTQIVSTSMLDRNSLAWYMRKIVAKGTGWDRILYRKLCAYGVSVLSHSGHVGRRSSISTIGWIPDFQHIHLPEFFSSAERSQRDRHFMDLCQHCDKVIVSSECAKADLKIFAPRYAHKTEVLQFVASPAPFRNAANLEELQQRYGFVEPYFLLPNQFWAHKNHRVVVQALQILKQQSVNIKILVTGAASDYRQPAHFSSLMEYVKECNVPDTFQVLGSVPYDHLVGLMRYAISFINPSTFEGWSTSVEEAKSMGKQVILSDIPVHREQAPERGIFFPVSDAHALAEALLGARRDFDMQADIAMQEKASAQFPARQRAFAEVYLRIVADALAHC